MGTNFTMGNVLRIFIVIIAAFLITGIVINASGGIQKLLQNICDAVPQICGEGAPTERSIEMARYNTNALVAALKAVFTNDPDKAKDYAPKPSTPASNLPTGGATTLGEESGEELGIYLTEEEKATVECEGIPMVERCCEEKNYYNVDDKSFCDQISGEIVDRSYCLMIKIDQFCCEKITYERKLTCTGFRDKEVDISKCGGVRTLATACTVKNFRLKEDLYGLYGEIKEHFAGFGNPSFLLYFQSFPTGEDSAWKMHDNLGNKVLSVLWVLPVTRIIGGLFKGGAKIVKFFVNLKKGRAVSSVGGKVAGGTLGRAVSGVKGAFKGLEKRVVYIVKKGTSKILIWKRLGNTKVKNYVVKATGKKLKNIKLSDVNKLNLFDEAKLAKNGLTRSAVERELHLFIRGEKTAGQVPNKYLNLLNKDGLKKVLDVTEGEIKAINKILGRGIVVGATTGMITEFLAARDKCETEKFTPKPSQVVLQRPLLCEPDQMEKHDVEETGMDQDVNRGNYFKIGELGMPLILDKGFDAKFIAQFGNPDTGFYLASPCHADLKIEPQDVECEFYHYNSEDKNTICMEPHAKGVGKESDWTKCGELFYKYELDTSNKVYPKFYNIVTNMLKESKLIFDDINGDGIYDRIIDPIDKKTVDDKVIYEIEPAEHKYVCCWYDSAGIVDAWLTKEYCESITQKPSSWGEVGVMPDEKCMKTKDWDTSTAVKPLYNVTEVKRVYKNGTEEDLSDLYLSLDGHVAGTGCSAEIQPTYKWVNDSFKCGEVVTFEGELYDSRIENDKDYCEELEDKPTGADICCEIRTTSTYTCRTTVYRVKYNPAIGDSDFTSPLGRASGMTVYADENKKFTGTSKYISQDYGFYSTPSQFGTMTIGLSDENKDGYWDALGKKYDTVKKTDVGGGAWRTEGWRSDTDVINRYNAIFIDDNNDDIFDSINQENCHMTGVVVKVENMKEYENKEKARGEEDVHNFCYQKHSLGKQIAGAVLVVLIVAVDAFITLESAGLGAVVALTVTEAFLAWYAHETLAPWPG